MAPVANGDAVASHRRVSDSWVRKSGTPSFSSVGVAEGHGRATNRSRVRAMIASRWRVRNSCSIMRSSAPAPVRQRNVYRSMVEGNDSQRS